MQQERANSTLTSRSLRPEGVSVRSAMRRSAAGDRKLLLRPVSIAFAVEPLCQLVNERVFRGATYLLLETPHDARTIPTRKKSRQYAAFKAEHRGDVFVFACCGGPRQRTWIGIHAP
eukprot:2269156-Rhodomonas_salina.1